LPSTDPTSSGGSLRRGGGGLSAFSIAASRFSACSSFEGTSIEVARNPATAEAPSVIHGYCFIR
jgi:hypothetical protein